MIQNEKTDRRKTLEAVIMGATFGMMLGGLNGLLDSFNGSNTGNSEVIIEYVTVAYPSVYLYIKHSRLMDYLLTAVAADSFLPGWISWIKDSI